MYPVLMDTQDLLELEEMLDASPRCGLDHTAIAGLPNCAITAVAAYRDCDGVELACEPLMHVLIELVRRANGECEHGHIDCITIRRL